MPGGAWLPTCGNQSDKIAGIWHEPRFVTKNLHKSKRIKQALKLRVGPNKKLITRGGYSGLVLYPTNIHCYGLTAVHSALFEWIRTRPLSAIPKQKSFYDCKKGPYSLLNAYLKTT